MPFRSEEPSDDRESFSSLKGSSVARGPLPVALKPTESVLTFSPPAVGGRTGVCAVSRSAIEKERTFWVADEAGIPGSGAR